MSRSLEVVVEDQHILSVYILGILVSFWDGFLAGAMLVLGGV